MRVDNEEMTVSRDRKIATAVVDIAGNHVAEIQWNGYATNRIKCSDAEHAAATARLLNGVYERGWDDAMSAVRELLQLPTEKA